MRWGLKKSIAHQIHTAGADYILSLKSNHPTLFQQVEQWFQQMQADGSSPTPREHTTESGHHRIDTRTVWTLGGVCRPLSSRRVGRTAKYCHRGTDSSVMEQNHPRSAVLLSSLPPHSPKIAAAIRQHWGLKTDCIDLDVTLVKMPGYALHAPHTCDLRRFAVIA